MRAQRAALSLFALIGFATASTTVLAELPPGAVGPRAYTTKQRVRDARQLGQAGNALAGEITKLMGPALPQKVLKEVNRLGVDYRHATKKQWRQMNALRDHGLDMGMVGTSRRHVGQLGQQPEKDVMVQATSHLTLAGAKLSDAVDHQVLNLLPAYGAARRERRSRGSTSAMDVALVPELRKVSITRRMDHGKRGGGRQLERIYTALDNGLVLQQAAYLQRRQGASRLKRAKTKYYLHTVDGRRRTISRGEFVRLAQGHAQLSASSKQWDKDLLRRAGVQVVTPSRGSAAGRTYFRRGPRFNADALTWVRGTPTRRAHPRRKPERTAD